MILLAVLLPLRGAAAAAPPCPGMGVGGELHTSVAPLGHHAMMASHGAHAAHHHGAGDRDGHPKCGACCDVCSVTPLFAGVPGLQIARDPTAVVFHDRNAPPPSFVSEGQERPPRST